MWPCHETTSVRRSGCSNTAPEETRSPENGSNGETNLPGQWSKTESVRWTRPLPGYSGATPIVWENSVFVSSPDQEKNLLLLCLERSNGQVRWERKIAAGNFEKGRNNSASPSPVTEGKRVFALFATGDLAAFDFSGTELWHRNLSADYGRFAITWIYGSSPMLHQGKLYVQVLQVELEIEKVQNFGSLTQVTEQLGARHAWLALSAVFLQ